MKSEIRSQKSEIRSQKSEIRSQKPESVVCPLSSVFCPLSSVVCLLVMLLANAGCEQLQGLPGLTAKTNNDVKELSVYSHYAPAKINIMPLTEFISAGGTQQVKIKPYVSLLDSFGSQIKSPAVFRFELYQRVLRSAEPKGRRVVIWPDIDLTDPAANNEYWRDFLRAYEFDLPFEPDASQSYILQVTCLCPNGRRISVEFALKLTK
ncbi:MAG: hypothetical protein IIB56_02290 [Planctomycetes bacterium]|nr:hypothetical protein [Planctomycetota bacterium]